MDEHSASAAPGSALAALWRRWGWAVRWAGTLVGVLYIVRLIDAKAVRLALGSVALSSVAITGGLVLAGVLAGLARWLILLRAYGATAMPDLRVAARIYFVSLFYNTYIPGGVVGDVMRGVVSRDSFGERGTTGALTVVFVERALGLVGLVMLASFGLMTAGRALPDATILWWWSALGLAAASGAIVAVALGRRLAGTPGRLGRLSRRLPAVVDVPAFAAAALLSLVTQLMVALAGWILLRDLHADVPLTAALLIVPISAATAFLPITVGGAGAREAVFISLCGSVLGMSGEAALAASLLLWFSILVISAIGGVLQLTRGRSPAARPSRTEAGTCGPSRE